MKHSRLHAVQLAGLAVALGDLSRWLSSGACTTAGLDRAGIVREALPRGEAMLGQDVPTRETYVVGDTPRDIDTARAVGGTAIGVATGQDDVAALKEAGADHVVATMEAPLPV